MQLRRTLLAGLSLCILSACASAFPDFDPALHGWTPVHLSGRPTVLPPDLAEMREAAYLSAVKAAERRTEMPESAREETDISGVQALQFSLEEPSRFGAYEYLGGLYVFTKNGTHDNARYHSAVVTTRDGAFMQSMALFVDEWTVDRQDGTQVQRCQLVNYWFGESGFMEQSPELRMLNIWRAAHERAYRCN